MILYYYACTIFITVTCESLPLDREYAPNVGTVLFSASDIQKKQWDKSKIGLLQARKFFQKLLPPPIFINTFNEDHVNSLLGYFKDAYAAIKKEAKDPETDTIMTTALSDAIGGYLKVWILPVAKLDYYGGTISEGNVVKLFQFYNEIKRYLDTNGDGWHKPDEKILNSLTINVAPLQLFSNTRFTDDPCDNLAYFEKSSTGLTIPTPHVNWKDKSSTMFVPLKNVSLILMKTPDTSHNLIKYYDAAKRCIQTSNPEQQELFDKKFQKWLIDEVVPHLKDENLYLALGSVLTLVNRTQALCNSVLDLYVTTDLKVKPTTKPKVKTKKKPKTSAPWDISSKKMWIITIILLIEIAWCIPALILVLCFKKFKKEDCSSNVYLFIDNDKKDKDKRKSKTSRCEITSENTLDNVPDDPHIIRKTKYSNIELIGQYPSSQKRSSIDTGTVPYRKFSPKTCLDRVRETKQPQMCDVSETSSLKESSSIQFCNSAQMVALTSPENFGSKQSVGSFATVRARFFPPAVDIPTKSRIKRDNDGYKRHEDRKRSNDSFRKPTESRISKDCIKHAELTQAEERGKLQKRRHADEYRKLQERRQAEEFRQLVERTQAEEFKQLVERTQAEERRKLEKRRQAEEYRKLEERKQAEECRKLEERRQAEECRKLEERRQAEERTKAEECKKIEERTQAEDDWQPEENKQSNEHRILVELRQSEENMKLEEAEECMIIEERTQAEECKILEERTQPEECPKLEERTQAEECKGFEVRRQSGEGRQPEENKQSEEYKKLEECCQAGECRTLEECCQAGECRTLEERRQAEESSTLEECCQAGECRTLEEQGQTEECRTLEYSMLEEYRKFSKLDERRKSDDNRKFDGLKKLQDRKICDDSKDRKQDETEVDECMKLEERRKLEECRRRKKAELYKYIEELRNLDERGEVDQCLDFDESREYVECSEFNTCVGSYSKTDDSSLVNEVKYDNFETETDNIDDCNAYNNYEELTCSTAIVTQETSCCPLCTCIGCVKQSSIGSNSNCCGMSLIDKVKKEVKTKEKRKGDSKFYSGKSYLEITIDRPGTEICVDMSQCRTHSSPYRPSKIPKPATCSIIQPASGRQSTCSSPVHRQKSLIPQLKKDLAPCHCRKPTERKLNDSF